MKNFQFWLKKQSDLTQKMTIWEIVSSIQKTTTKNWIENTTSWKKDMIGYEKDIATMWEKFQNRTEKTQDWENELKDCSQEFTCLNDEMQNDWKITNNWSLKFYLMNNKQNDRSWNTKRTRSKIDSISWWLSCRTSQRKAKFWNSCCVIELNANILNSRINHHFKAILIHQTIELKTLDWLWKLWISQLILWTVWRKRWIHSSVSRFNHCNIECEFATFGLFIIYFEIKWKIENMSECE